MIDLFMSETAHDEARHGGSRSQPGGILGNRDPLQAISGARIMTADEAVAHVHERIQNRDQLCRMISTDAGSNVKLALSCRIERARD